MSRAGLRGAPFCAAAVLAVALAALAVAGLALPAIARPTTTPTPSPTTVDERVENLEKDLQELKDEAKDKDVWDKLEASGPLIGGVLVAIIGAFATILYNVRQQRATDHQAAQELKVNRVQTLGELIPFLSSQDPRLVEAALVSIAQLGDPELATSMAAIYKGEGGVGALQRLASGPNAAVAETARATLASVFEDVRQSVAVVLNDGHPRGTAVFVSTNKLVTPNYVIDTGSEGSRLTELRVGDIRGSVKASFTLGDDPRDLAVLECALPGRPVRIGSSKNLAIGDRVTIVGLGPHTSTDKPEMQVLSAVVEGLIAADKIRLGAVQINLGMGGGPVFDASGSMVGMVVMTVDPDSRMGGIAIPSEAIVEALEKQKDQEPERNQP